MIKQITIVLFLIFSCLPAYAGNIWDKTHQIDVWTESALKDAAGVTPKIIDVYSTAYNKWDRALNSTYKLLMQKLPDKDKKLLRNSQRKWLKYKDAEFRFMPVHVQRKGGSLSRVITHERMNNFVRARVIELEAYITIFDSPP